MSVKKYYGIYQGIVTNINDPEKRGRIKVICPSVLGGNTESAWCDPVVPVAYDNGGDFCLPTRDEAVWLQFIEGDANKPVYLGGWWQKEKTPLGKNYSNIDRVRIIKYADCTITMQNGKIDINTDSGEFDLRIQDKKLTINGNLNVSGTISAQSITAVGENGTITAKSVEVSSVKTNSLQSGTTNAGTLSATSVTADSVVADGVSLSEHTHGGVASGSGSTSTPN